MFTESDFITLVIPAATFGLFGAIANPEFHGMLVVRTGQALLFVWTNLLVFNLANQGTEAAVLEDKINKPWRPIPSGRITIDQTITLLLCCIPLVLGLSWCMDVGVESSLLIHLTWIYNQGGGEHWFVRNVILSAAFGLFNSGSARLTGYINYEWTALVSVVILTTMQVQDLKDQDGDRLRGRKTLPLVIGDVARWTVAVPLVLWSIVCPWFLGCTIWGYVMAGSGIVVAMRVLWSEEDKLTWKCWAGWLILLYALPVMR